MVIRLQAGKSRKCGSIPGMCHSPSSLVCNGVLEVVFPGAKQVGVKNPTDLQCLFLLTLALHPRLDLTFPHPQCGG
jgi:hypothetical protein